MDNETLMPMRCTSCGTPIRQKAITDALEEGVPIRDVFRDLDLVKICCRDLVMSQPSAVGAQKRVAQRQAVKDRL